MEIGPSPDVTPAVTATPETGPTPKVKPVTEAEGTRTVRWPQWRLVSRQARPHDPPHYLIVEGNALNPIHGRVVATVGTLAEAKVFLQIRPMLFTLRNIAAVPVPELEPPADTAERTLWDVVRAAQKAIATLNPPSPGPAAPKVQIAR